MLLNQPAKFQEHLSERLSGDPGRDAEVLCALLEEGRPEALRRSDYLAALDTFWPHAADTLNQIEQRVSSSHIPLSPAMLDMVAAYRRLGERLLGLFVRAVEDLRDSREPWWGTSKRLIALTRAADLLTRLGLMHRLSYHDLPPTYWPTFHGLLLEGERTAHLRDHLPLGGTDTPSEPSLEERYLAFALLEVCIPDGLPHQEIRPLYRCLLALASQTQLEPLTTVPAGGPFIHGDLHDARPPSLGGDRPPAPGQGVRLIRLPPVLAALEGMLRQHPQDHIALPQGGGLLSRGTLERTLSLLQERPRRHVNRQLIGGEVCVWAGRTSIIRKLGGTADAGPAAATGLRLLHEGLDTPPSETLNLQPRSAVLPAEALWEQVAKHHLLEGELSPPPKAVQETSPAQPGIEAPRPWRLVDLSPSGMRLHGDGGSDAHLNMGEPVLVMFPQGDQEVQVIGILRWLHTQADHSLDIGLEIIAHSAVVLRVSAAGCNTTVWLDALLLTRSRLADGPLLVLPNHDYQPGDLLVTQRHGVSTRMRLGEKMLQTVAVAIFRCCAPAAGHDEMNSGLLPCAPLIDETP